MSFNRENIVWQSANGSWNIGFFRVECYPSYGEDFDPEWDVEYDFSEFEWVSVGHNSEDEAYRAWKGANPGGGMIMDYTEGESEIYDKMAETYLERDR